MTQTNDDGTNIDNRKHTKKNPNLTQTWFQRCFENVIMYNTSCKDGFEYY